MMREYRIDVGETSVGALLVPARSTHRVTLTLGHGAGAGMTHASMQAIAEACADVGIATLRYNFPFKEQGRSRVDAQAVSTATVAAALECARDESPGPHLLGGHSYGGRMASHAVVDHGLDVAGLVFCSFPLHMPRKPAIKRAEHLDGIAAPMLFLSGTRDGMAQPELLNDIVTRIGATVNWLDTADHGYKVLKRTRERSDSVFEEMAHYASGWLDTVLTA
ncbi:MAG: alpha/beta fold hydrolase [Gammaproteobacteria bacterium]|nr:alpha/beta fold hydrolase [Gammaproteobacteria bacterium]